MDANDNPPQNFDGVTALWDELSRFGGHESDAAAKVLMQRVGGWIEAQNAFWVGLVRVMKEPDAKRADPMHGWRIRSISPLHAQYHDPALNRKIVKATTPPKDPGATNITLMRAAGAFRAHSLQRALIIVPATLSSMRLASAGRRAAKPGGFGVAFAPVATASAVA